jgi:hypothetical protein
MATNEERFSNVDPNDLPPEMQALYKSLQRDYTQKRQADSAKAAEAQQKLEQTSSQYQQLAQQYQTVRQYASSVEDNNLKWQEWYKDLDASGILQAGKQGAQSAQDQGFQQSAAQPGAGKMSATDRELLNSDLSQLSPQQLEAVDKHFLGKYGQTIQGLSDNVYKLQKQLGYTLQLSDLKDKRGKDFNIDPKRVIDAAVSIGTDNLNVAFETAYAKELQESAFAERLAKAKEEWAAENKTSALDGVSRSRQELFYTKKPETSGSYEDASQTIADELVNNPKAAFMAD